MWGTVVTSSDLFNKAGCQHKIYLFNKAQCSLSDALIPHEILWGSSQKGILCNWVVKCAIN
ncbi:hypothetical protein EXD76_08630 [BEV proteobacterium]|nr:hypothetical protein [Candidatus Symbiopectobacterium sp. Chty_BC]